MTTRSFPDTVESETFWPVVRDVEIMY